MESVVNIVSRIIGYVLFVPFICFYSYVLGPMLKAVLIPGGVVVLALIMGPAKAWRVWKAANG